MGAFTAPLEITMTADSGASCHFIDNQLLPGNPVSVPILHGKEIEMMWSQTTHELLSVIICKGFYRS